MALAHALCVAACLGACAAQSVWDPVKFGRGRLPRVDDVLQNLTWGQLQVLHTTDIHGWYQGHNKLSPPEPNYSGDWGDWIAFTEHMKRRAHARGVDLLLVDTGDLRTYATANADDGNGLSDAVPPAREGNVDDRHTIPGHVSNEVFALADYDLLTIGNHELYDFRIARDVYENFAPKWGHRYVTSNVNITLRDADGEERSRPIGARYTRFQTPQQGLHIQAYGVLFNFQLGAPGITVQDPRAMVDEPWFQASLRAHDQVDAFVVAGHMPVTGHDGWDAVHAAIRAVWPHTPILMLAGHTHVRDCKMLDEASMVLESGRYLETIGWMSVSNVSTRPSFSRTYIDANPRNYAHHAGLDHAGHLSTRRGRFVRATMEAIATAWNLTELYGVVPEDYYLDREAYGEPHALLTLLAQRILPEVVRPANPRHEHTPTLVLLNSGSQRFDMFQGLFTKNDQYIVSPFRDAFLYVNDVPWHVAKQLCDALNRRGATHNEQPGGTHPAQGAADSIFQRYLRRQWATFGRASEAPPVASGRPEAARRVEALLAGVAENPALAKQHPHLHGKATPSLGYVTVDSCPGPGDDTQHRPLPYSPAQPDYIAAEPKPTPKDDTLVDVVLVDFIARPLIQLLNAADPQRHYTMDDMQVWGNVSTQWLYPIYAQRAWTPPNGAQVWAAMDEAASRAGYPPLAQWDTYAAHPYAPVELARASRLRFQP